MKIAVFLDSDLTIRHFMLSGGLSELIRRHDVVLVLPPVGHRRINSPPDALERMARIERVDIPFERARIWTRCFVANQMQLPTSQSKFWLWNMRWATHGFKVGLIYSILGLPIIRQIAFRYFRRQLENIPASSLEQFIANEKPDLLLHPSTFDGYFINDMIEIGRVRGIPTVLIMNSWDNPSVKRTVSGLPDWVLVWGEQTRRHSMEFMHLQRERAIVVGAAQFDVFRSPPRISRADFCREHSIAEGETIVLYAGSSKMLKEYDHLDALENGITKGELPPIKVVYRPHPFGLFPDQAQKILGRRWRHVVLERSMFDFLRTVADGSNKGFHMAEYARTHDILSSVDAVISPLSTMLIEAALHGRPILCFYPSEEVVERIWRSLGQLVHFRELFRSSMMLTARSHADLLPKVRKLIARITDKKFSKAMEQEVRFFVEMPAKRYPEALADTVEQVMAHHVAVARCDQSRNTLIEARIVDVPHFPAGRS